MKRKQNDYEQKRNQLVAFYESVKSAQQVTVDEIPLPQLPQQAAPSNTAAQIPLPTSERRQEHTIYSIATALKFQALVSRCTISVSFDYLEYLSNISHKEKYIIGAACKGASRMSTRSSARHK